MNHHSPEKGQHHEAHGVVTVKHRLMSYLHKCVSVVTDAAVLLAVTIAVSIASLYIGRVLWHLYLATAVGQQFVQLFPQTAQGTAHLLQMDLVRLSVEITIYSFVICIATGSLCRVFYLGRYLYEQFGALGRTALCGLPLTAVVATVIQPVYGFHEWSTAFTVAFLPTLFVFSRCFSYAAKLLPELGEVKDQVIRS
jgi:hypothetical protein